MVADEPDFEKYPKTCAEFAGVVAKEVCGRLLDGALWWYDRLRHVAMAHRVESPVRGWEGRVWEVGDGEVDGPVPSGRVQWKGEPFYDPPLVAFEPEQFTRLVEQPPGGDDVVAGVDLDLIRDVPRGGPVDR